MDKLYWGAVAIFAIGWYIEQRMYVNGYTRRKRDPYKPIDYLGMFSIGEFVGYLMHQKRLCHRLPMPTGAGLTSQMGVLRRRSFFHRMLPLQTQQQA